MIIIYALIAIVFLLLVWILSKRGRSRQRYESLREIQPSPSNANGRWLHLSERIFDPSDVHWVREELGLPDLAHSLMSTRRRLAVCWLEALQTSFDALVRTPEFSAGEVPEVDTAGSWKILWLTVRFKFAVSYALLVVKFFGPYNRLIPSFTWIPLPRRSERGFRRPALVNSRSSH